MIKILDQDVYWGVQLSQLVATCPDVLECLWDRQKKCGKRCDLVEFRETFERQSPAFFGLCKRLSGYQSVFPDLRLIEIEGSPEQKYEVRERFHDLQTFSQAWTIVLYPLFLANNKEIPFLTVKEINEVEENFPNLDYQIAKKELEQFNTRWLERWDAISNNFYDEENFRKKTYLVFRVFMRGLEKSGSPAGFLSESEKEDFFKTLEKFIFSHEAL